MPIKKLVAQIEPVQDLHGYDSPWPAGGGKNKVNYSVAFPIVSNGITISQNDDGSISINGTATANINQILMAEVAIDNGAWTISGVPTNSAGGNLSIWARNTTGGTEYERTYNGLPGTLNISTGSVYIYCTISSGTTVDNVKVYLQLEAGSTATDWTPYENICPISGHTGMTVARTGKNLLNNVDPIILNAYYNTATVSAENENQRIVVIRCKPNTAYTFQWNRVAISGTQTARVCAFSALPTYGLSGSLMAASVAENGTATFTTGASDIYIGIYLGDIRTTNFSASLTASMLEEGSTATAYEPYTGNQISVNWEDEAGTVYGGTVTLNEDGSADVVATMASADLGSLNWTINGDTGVVQDIRSSGLASVIKPVSSNVTPNLLSDIYRTESRQNQTSSPNTIGVTSSGNLGIAVATNSYQTAEDFKAAIAGHYICYELLRPQSWHIPDVGSLSTFLGTNNIWADTGDIQTCEYPADTKLYIDGKLAEIQATILENIGG